MVEYKNVQKVVDGKKSPLIKLNVPHTVVNETAELTGKKAIKAAKLLETRSVTGQLNDIRDLVLKMASTAGLNNKTPEFKVVSDFAKLAKEV